MHRLRWTLLWMLGLAAPAAAHHGWSEYDTTTKVLLVGTIRASGYEHPHGHIALDADGKRWHVVLAPPSRMQARGLPAAKLKPGVKAQVHGYVNRSKPGELRAEDITIGGKTVELR